MGPLIVGFFSYVILQLTAFSIMIFYFFEVKNFPIIANPYRRFTAPLPMDLGLWFLITIPYLLFNDLILTSKGIIIETYFQMVVLTLIFAFYSSSLFQHLLLRILLSMEGKIPFFIDAFLDEVAKTGLMSKSGGIWRFKHPSIQNKISKWNEPNISSFLTNIKKKLETK